MVARTDWQVISGGGVFDPLNLANLTGFAALARGETLATAAMIERQLLAPVETALGGGLAHSAFRLDEQPAASQTARTHRYDVCRTKGVQPIRWTSSGITRSSSSVRWVSRLKIS